MNPVFVDKDLIRIAVTNLMSNAVKYNKDGGTVKVTVEAQRTPCRFGSPTRASASAKKKLRRFLKFYRSTDDRVQAVNGHGFGLALVKADYGVHQGTLILNRDREEGVEFIINLWTDATAVKQAI